MCTIFSCMFQMIQNKYFKCPYFFRYKINTCSVLISSEIQNKIIPAVSLFLQRYKINTCSVLTSSEICTHLPLRDLESDLAQADGQQNWCQNAIVLANINGRHHLTCSRQIKMLNPSPPASRVLSRWVHHTFFHFRVHLGESCWLIVLRELAFWKQILLKRAKQKLKIKGFVLNLVLTMDDRSGCPASRPAHLCLWYWALWCPHAWLLDRNKQITQALLFIVTKLRLRLSKLVGVLHLVNHYGYIERLRSTEHRQ